MGEEIKFDNEILSFAVSYFHTMILDSNREVSLFGRSENESGEKLDSYFSGMKLNISDICLMSSGSNHSFLKTRNDQVWGFGGSDYHKLGIKLEEEYDGDGCIIAPYYSLTEIPALSKIIGSPQYMNYRQKAAR